LQGHCERSEAIFKSNYELNLAEVSLDVVLRGKLFLLYLQKN
jgi:hypothetical protein